MVANGVVLDGHDMTMVVDHKCRNKHCVSPHHLQYISNGDNLRRTPSHDLSHVDYHRPEVHDLKPEDIFYTTAKNRPGKYMRCRPCHRAYAREYQRRKREGK